MGRLREMPSQYVICPFCGEGHTVYTWSFHGSGKKCHNCKNVFGSGSYTLSEDSLKERDIRYNKVKKKIDIRQQEIMDWIQIIKNTEGIEVTISDELTVRDNKGNIMREYRLNFNENGRITNDR